jgi:hypothetical protein
LEDAGVDLDYIPLLTSFLHVDEMLKGAFPAFLKGKPRYVPGLMNKITYLGIIKYLPHKLSNMLVRFLAHRLSEYLPESVVGHIVRLRTR